MFFNKPVANQMALGGLAKLQSFFFVVAIWFESNVLKDWMFMPKEL